VTMRACLSNAAGNAAGRYHLRPQQKHRGQAGGLRQAEALSDSPQLKRLLEDLRDVFDCEVLTLLNRITRALLGRVGQACRDLVMRSPGLPCAGRTCGVKLLLVNFVRCVGLLAWAKENGCPLNEISCAVVVGGRRVGTKRLLQWARKHGCPWDVWNTLPVRR
jgi:hypothetical protein